jgi:hypothetical protein
MSKLKAIFFVLLIISISYANTQETAVEHNNTRVSVYLHPFSTFSGIILSILSISPENPYG